MRFHVLTLFPEMIRQGCSHGVVGQAVKDGKIRIETVNPRDFATDVHRSVDDRPFGGGDGMVLLPEPLAAATGKALSAAGGPARKIYLSARGRPFSDAMSRELATVDEVVLLCGRYGGVDQRLIEAEGYEEVSIGDYVLSGGELGALVVIDAVSRHRPGVLGNSASSFDESFAEVLLEHPQYTRPREWLGLEVPVVLLSGNHAKVRDWRRNAAVLLTAQARPELLSDAMSRGVLNGSGVRAALEALEALSDGERRAIGLRDPGLVRARLRPFSQALSGSRGSEP